MKKIIIPVILAAVLGVGGGITAVMLNRSTVANADTNEDEVPTNINVKSGKYYLNGDKSSDLWVVVTPDFLQLQGNDVDKSIKDAIIKEYEEDDYMPTPTDDVLQKQFETDKTLYCNEKAFILESFLPEESKYMIRVSRDDKHTDPESLKNSGAAFIFNADENSIHLGLFGDFILVE